MPRCKLEKLVDNPSPPRKYPPKSKPAIDAPIGSDLAPAIVPSIPVTIQPVKGELKKLAGTPYWVDVDSGLLYLDEKILKALKNN